MPSKKCVKRFEDAQAVMLKPGLDEDRVISLKRHLGFGDHVPMEEFISMKHTIIRTCPEQGILVPGAKNGVYQENNLDAVRNGDPEVTTTSVGTWICARFVDPVTETTNQMVGHRQEELAGQPA